MACSISHGGGEEEKGGGSRSSHTSRARIQHQAHTISRTHERQGAKLTACGPSYHHSLHRPVEHRSKGIYTVRYDGHLRWLKYVGSGEMCTHHGRFCEELKCLQILTITQAGHLFWPGVQLFELKLKLSPDLHKVICQVG